MPAPELDLAGMEARFPKGRPGSVAVRELIAALRAERERVDGVRRDLADARSLIAEVTDITDKPPRWMERARDFLDRAQSPTHEYLAEIVALRERVGALAEIASCEDTDPLSREVAKQALGGGR